MEFEERLRKAMEAYVCTTEFTDLVTDDNTRRAFRAGADWVVKNFKIDTKNEDN